MLWFFRKENAWLHYEIRRQSDGPGFELAITYADGRQEVERYPDSAALAERSQRLHQDLTTAGWQPPPVVRRGAAGSRVASAGPMSPGRG
jgi:hypothetical protein